MGAVIAVIGLVALGVVFAIPGDQAIAGFLAGNLIGVGITLAYFGRRHP